MPCLLRSRAREHVLTPDTQFTLKARGVPSTRAMGTENETGIPLLNKNHCRDSKRTEVIPRAWGLRTGTAASRDHSASDPGLPFLSAPPPRLGNAFQRSFEPYFRNPEMQGHFGTREMVGLVLGAEAALYVCCINDGLSLSVQGFNAGR